MKNETKRYFVQAPVQPFDADGVKVGTFGSVCFALASLVLVFRYDSLAQTGHLWYLAVAVTGTLIGVMFTGWAINRRHNRTKK